MGSLFLVRHATTEASEAGVNLGQRTDPPLTDAGRALAARAGAAIRAELDALSAGEMRTVTSPAARCRQTADAICLALGQRPDAARVEAGLWEIDYGAWEGLSAEECRRRDPELRARWERDPYRTATPGGESGADVARRSAAALDPLERWLAQSGVRAAVAVTHNHVVRLRLAALLGLPPAEYRRRVVADPGAYSLVTFSGERATVRRVNILADY